MPGPHNSPEPSDVRTRVKRMERIAHSAAPDRVPLRWPGRRRGQEAAAFAQKIRDKFATLYAEGEEHGKVMNIALHPFIMGQPHRIDHLAGALQYILSHSGVWCATGSDIIDWYRQHTAAAPCATFSACSGVWVRPMPQWTN